MSQLRAPAARSDRREGGRHGRPGARSLSSSGRWHPAPSPPEARIRPRLLRAAVLPTLGASLSGAGAVVATVRAAAPQPSPGLWAVLTAAAALAMASIAAAALGADRTAKSVLDRCAALRRTAARGQADLRGLVDRLRRGEGPPARDDVPFAPLGGDEFDLLTQELGRGHEAAVTAVVQASRLSTSAGNEQKVEVFVNLARRLQSLVHREIQLLDELENDVEDPDLLKGLFHVDLLATRIRRHAENLAVLGGAISRRQWSNPVPMTEVLRSSIAEVEQYPRVKLVPPIDGTLRGHAVADVIHLLAELVENATLFSAPHTQVMLRAQHVTAGLAVEVEDRGLGMPPVEQARMNALLADPDQVSVAQLLRDGRIGLFVVSALARRHGIAVRLQSNIYGGVQAVLVLPQGLLGAEQDDPENGQTAQALAVEAGPQTAATLQQGVRQGGHSAGVPHGAGQPAHPARPPDTARNASQRPAASHRGSHPLPVRGEHDQRPDPAAAFSGVPHAALSQHPEAEPGHTAAGPPSVPRVDDWPHGERPKLPRRRSQEHLVPQLRDARPPRRDDEHILHDPGLMAAFQRGVGLAESQSAADRAVTPPQRQRHDNTSKE
ncbi:ATP-binding protein [Streptomyces sp. MUM 178J]|uniref:ATP-binding protein n=1 Tax=Streptomyces sp. MUM 178J TaxID=2791991 RepID=UPI001F0383E9|nr:ATP-binding protein [Streptomyces sp. MUM 178J]WRQ80008.1 ATP-binding protein [Streptomyces sp. MUM 178J]